MRRTYRSKKDTGGTLHHRDVLQHLDEKSSAFDAFYIQNIKQSRELSCVGPSTAYGIASNRVRKRKFVKRIVKDIENIQPRESKNTTTCLTPNKSIRVNKILDPFDMLINSSSNGQVACRSPALQTLLPKKQGKTYSRKKKAVKKFNYSSDSFESDKENTSNTQSNTTDIRRHELIIEKLNNIPNNFDESINKIVKNISLLNSLKQKTSNNSFNTSYKLKNRLLKNCQSPILQRSPLCSTPFKEKYRGKSIYNFSPISVQSKESPNYGTISEENNESSNSIVFPCKEKKTKLCKGETSGGINTITNYTIEKYAEQSVIYDDIEAKDISGTDKEDNNIKNSVEESMIYDDIEIIPDKCENDNEICPVEANKSSELLTEQSLSQITQAEPFLGFSNIKEHDTVTNAHNYLLQLMEENVSKNLNESEKSFGYKDFDNDIHRSKEKSLGFHHSLDDEEINESYLLDEIENRSESINRGSSCVPVQNRAASVLSNNISSSSNYDNSSVNSKEAENESLYDTCNSDQSISEDKITDLEPKVTIEKLNDSLFLKYYKKRLIDNQDSSSVGSGRSSEGDEVENLDQGDENNVDQTSNESDNENTDSVSSDLDIDENLSFHNCSQNTSVTSKTESDYDNPRNEILITDSSTTEDNIESNEDTSGNVQIHASFVTTRRRIDLVNDSMYIYDNCNGSSSTDCDMTLLSNKAKLSCLEKTDSESDVGKKDANRKGVEERNIQVCTDKKHRRSSRMSYRLSKDSIQSAEINSSYNVTIVEPEVLGDSFDDNINKDISKQKKVLDYARSSITTRKSSRLHKIDTNRIDLIEERNIQVCTDKKHRRSSRKSYRLSKDSIQRTEMNCSNNVTIAEPEVLGDSSDDNIYKDISKQKDVLEYARSSITTRKSSRLYKDSLMPDRSSSIDAELKPSIVLQPGKKWERSLSIYRRMTTMADHFDSSILEDEGQKKGRKYRQSVISTMEMQDSPHNESINSRRSTFISKPSRSTIRFVKDSNSSRISLNTTEVFDDLKGFLNEECDDTVIELSKLSLADSEFEVTVLDKFNESSERIATARDYVLRRCNQTDPILFDECYPETVLKNCHKIGEGVYGEVFLWRGSDGRARVMKIVPIAGTVKVNGETQKDFHEVISEIVIAMELSALRAPIAEIDRFFDEGKDVESLDLHTVENATDVFNEVLAVRCVQGPYPSRLLDLWELYDECRGSENDNPASLPRDQQYIVLELANAGQDLESYTFTGAQQAHALFQQIAFGLAVGEESFQFEHRDLHWGNVLISPTEQKVATFVLNGRTYRVPRGGVAATIIDYSLSRVTLPLAADRAALYNDLATDEQLFEAVGDYQFQVYRLMRDKLGNDWKNFEPYTNILWLHYTVDKMITALRYKRTTTKIHKHYIEKLKGIKDRILAYKSATDYVLSDIEI